MGAATETAWQTGPRRSATPSGVYKPRRPQTSPLYRLIDDHFEEFSTVYDERFSRRWGFWRSVVGDVVDKFLDCGILKHGFARARCGSCKYEFLLAFYKGQVLQRYYGFHSSRQRGKRRWAVDPLACSRCGKEMRIVAFITEPKVIDRILEHLRRTQASRRLQRAPPRRWKSATSTTSA